MPLTHSKQKYYPLLIFVFVLVIHILSPVTTNTDSKWTLYVSASILREGNINLDEYGGIVTNLKTDYHFRFFGDHIYYYYPAATPILTVPYVWLIEQLYPLRYSTDFYTYLARHEPMGPVAKHLEPTFTGKLEKIYASFIVALAAIVTYFIARETLSANLSLLVTFIFAFSTSMWSTASRALWQHGPSVLFFSLALYLLIKGKKDERLIIPVGFLLAITYTIRPNNSIAVIFLTLYVLLVHRRQFITYMIGAALIAIPFLVQNWMIYGVLLPPYSFQLLGRTATFPNFMNALAGNLISPGRGLFIFSPIFLFSIYGIILRFKSRKFNWRELDPYLLAIIILNWLLNSAFEQWDGGWSIGPRYFTDIIPCLIYFLIPVFEDGSILFTKPVWRTALITTFAIGVLINGYCSFSIYPFMWNGKPTALVAEPQRVWDWTDLQFLRGLCKNDPMEGQAPACWFGSTQ